MTLLTICQTAAEEVGFTAPGTIISNTDATAIRLKRIASRVGKTMAKKNWPELIKPYTFSTSAAEPQYVFPSDFRSMINNTAWNQTTDKQIFLLTPQLWSYEKSANVTTIEDKMRFLGDDAAPSVGSKLTLHPTPNAIETIRFEYYSTSWCTSGGGTEQSDFAADSDLVVLDEDLFTLGVVWRMLKSIGQPYTEEKTEFDQQQEICFAQSGGTETLHADGNTTTLSNIPETGFG